MRQPNVTEAPVDIGLIVPSSNTVVEPVTAAIAARTPSIRAFHTRVAVTRIAADHGSDSQFEQAVMSSAATLLGHAAVDVVAWAGTSGSWLGLDHDRDFARVASLAASAPATTSTMGLLEACKEFNITRIGLVTPYTADIVERIQARYMIEGVEVVAERHFSLTDNRSFASVDSATIRNGVLEVADHSAEAVAIVCTNIAAAELAPTLEQETGLPVFDSVVATIWHAAKLANITLIAPGFGQLLGLRSSRQTKRNAGAK